MSDNSLVDMDFNTLPPQKRRLSNEEDDVSGRDAAGIDINQSLSPASKNLQASNQKKRTASRPARFKPSDIRRVLNRVESIADNTPRTSVSANHETRGDASKVYWDIRQAIESQTKQLQLTPSQRRLSELQYDNRRKFNRRLSKYKRPRVEPLSNTGNKNASSRESTKTISGPIDNGRKSIPNETARLYGNTAQNTPEFASETLASSKNSDPATINELCFKVVHRNILGQPQAEEYRLRLDNETVQRYQSWAKHQKLEKDAEGNNDEQRLIPETSFWRHPPGDLLEAAYVELWDYSKGLREDHLKKKVENEILARRIAKLQTLPGTPLFKVEPTGNNHIGQEEQIKQLRKDNAELWKQLDGRDPAVVDDEIVDYIMRQVRSIGQYVNPREQDVPQTVTFGSQESHEELEASFRAQLEDARKREVEQDNRIQRLDQDLERERQQLRQTNEAMQQIHKAVTSRDHYIHDLQFFCQQQTDLAQTQGDMLSDLQTKLEIVKTKYEEMKFACREAYFWVKRIEHSQYDELNQIQLRHEKEKMEMFSKLKVGHSNDDAPTSSLNSVEETHIQRDAKLTSRVGLKSKPRPINSMHQPMPGLPQDKGRILQSEQPTEASQHVQCLSPASIREMSMTSQSDLSTMFGDRCHCNRPQPYTGIGRVRRSCKGRPGHFRLFKDDIVDIAHWDYSRQGMYCVRHRETGWQGCVTATNLEIIEIPHPFNPPEYYGPKFNPPKFSAFISKVPKSPEIKSKIQEDWVEKPVQIGKYVKYWDAEKLRKPWKDFLSTNPIGHGTGHGRVRSKSTAKPGRLIKYGANIDLLPLRTVADGMVDDRGYMSDPVTYTARSGLRRGSIPEAKTEEDAGPEADLEFLESHEMWRYFSPRGRLWQLRDSRKRPGYLNAAGLRQMAQIARWGNSDQESSSPVKGPSSDPDVEALIEIFKDRKLGYDLIYQMTDESTPSEPTSRARQLDRFLVSTDQDIISPGSSRLVMRRLPEAELLNPLPDTSLCHVQPRCVLWWEPRLRSATIQTNVDESEETMRVVLVRQHMTEANDMLQCLANGRLVDLAASELKVEDIQHWPMFLDVLSDLQGAEQQWVQENAHGSALDLSQNGLNIRPIDLPIPSLHEYDLLFPIVEQHNAKAPPFLDVNFGEHVIINKTQPRRPTNTVACTRFGLGDEASGLVSKDAIDLKAPHLPVFSLLFDLGFKEGNWVVILKRQGDKICCCLPDQSKAWFMADRIPLDLELVGYHELAWLLEQDVLPHEDMTSEVQYASQPEKQDDQGDSDFYHASLSHNYSIHTYGKAEAVTSLPGLPLWTSSISPVEISERTPVARVATQAKSHVNERDQYGKPDRYKASREANVVKIPAYVPRAVGAEASSGEQNQGILLKVPKDKQSPQPQLLDTDVSETIVNDQPPSIKKLQPANDGPTEAQWVVPYINYKKQKELHPTRSDSRAGAHSRNANVRPIYDFADSASDLPAIPGTWSALKRGKRYTLRGTFPKIEDEAKNVADRSMSAGCEELFNSPVWQSDPAANLTVYSPKPEEQGFKRPATSRSAHSQSQPAVTPSPNGGATTRIYQNLKPILTMYRKFTHVGKTQYRTAFWLLCHLVYWTALTWLFLGVLAAQQEWLDVNGVGIVNGARLVRKRRGMARGGGGWEWAVWEAVKSRLG